MDQSLQAAVFDLDGVITLTAGLHAAAWKCVFDRVLEAHFGASFQPFDLRGDYLQYVDGRPRLNGVTTFLDSRDIQLLRGEPSDPPSQNTAWGLGNLKNELFKELLEQQGADVDAGTVALVHALRQQGVRVAVASSSRNCQPILRKAGLLELFEAIVDGKESERLRLEGKPSPDIFLEAARRLGVSPDATVVIEDATSGVAAARDGGFGLVVGMDRHNQKAALRTHGADLVLERLGADCADLFSQWMRNRDHRLPSAWIAWPALVSEYPLDRLVVFLDYDGTLVPIADRPDEAILSSSMRSTLGNVARKIPTAIISGRGMEDVRSLADVDGLYVAGSHGFEIALPDGSEKVFDIRWREMIEDAAAELEASVRKLPGAILERKGFSVAVHYRLAAPNRVPWLQGRVHAVAAAYPELQQTPGKMVFELRPNLDWDKGRALGWLLEQIGPENAVPVYLGDDTTDEDGFAAVEGSGIGILVSAIPRATRASLNLQAPWEVQLFLQRLVNEI